MKFPNEACIDRLLHRLCARSRNGKLEQELRVNFMLKLHHVAAALLFASMGANAVEMIKERAEIDYKVKGAAVTFFRTVG